MKLVEIKDVRVGQVWKNSHWDLVVITKIDNDIIHIKTWDYDFHSFGEGYHNAEFLKDYRIIGKLGITHKIENNKLVEIPREDFQIDDIFYRYRDNPQIVVEVGEINSLTGYSPKEKCLMGHIANICCKIGIYGVTHEFVNDREAEND